MLGWLQSRYREMLETKALWSERQGEECDTAGLNNFFRNEILLSLLSDRLIQMENSMI